jgi:carbon monoxide dehydrogenase subunit G
MKIPVECLVAAPPDIAFAAAIDVSNWPRFISGIQSVAVLTPGPVTAGTRFLETRVMFGRQATEEMTFAEITPPDRFVLTAFNHGTAYRAEHLFAAEGAETRMTLVFEGHPSTLVSRLFAPLGRLFAGTVRRQLEADLADPKHETERRHRKRSAGPR